MTTQMARSSDELLAAARSVGPVVLQYRDEAEEQRNPPAPMVRAFREAGLLKMWTPREFGGDEVDLETFMRVVEEVSALDGAAGWTLTILGAGGAFGAYFPGAAVIFGSDPSTSIAGAIAPKGRAVPAQGGYRLSGQWPLASGCRHAEWLIGGSLVFDGEAPRMGPTGPELRVMAVPIADCEILDTWHSAGLRGTGSHDFVIHDVFVPEELTSPAFASHSHAGGPLYSGGIRPLFASSIAPVAIGIAQGAIESFLELAGAKTPTLSQTALKVRPTVHAEVGRAQALVHSARAYLHEVAREMMETLRSGDGMPEELEARRRLACTNAATSCARAVEMMYTLAGASSVYTGGPLERAMRDIHAVTQHMAVSPTWWEKAGQYYLGLGLGMP
jgi:alkylation response protein AidB-like acyl-CoA dehydrogenase